jgi:4-diphosphocytidyl-2-C-methyl-D-erythritol kinase
MQATARAKINLRLEVVGRRADGYHLLQSIMAPISLADELLLEPAKKGVHLTCDDPTLPTGAKNLVVRAAIALLAETGDPRGVRIHLIKRIPQAAGLGGGSSDAAATLLAVRELLGLPVTDERLHQLAVGLGADVPFFLMGRACVARGVGEVLQPFRVPAGLPLALVKPREGLSTPEVYRALGWPLTRQVKPSTLPRSLRDGPMVCAWLRNDLEAPAVALLPHVAECKELLRGAGALGVQMSGSGPTVFGIFDDPAAAARACARAKRKRLWAHAGALI